MVANTHTGLILVTGVDKPGVSQALFDALSPFALEVLDVEQLVIRERLILTVLLAIDPAHSKAIETDLMEFGEKTEMDVAIDFAEVAKDDLSAKLNLKKLVVLSKKLQPGALAKIAAGITGNIERINRLASTPLTILEIFYTGEIANRIELEETDVILIPENLKKYSRKLVVLDVDSTLIKQEAIELLANHAGVGPEVKEITEAAMRGELDFSESLKKRVSLLAGLSSEVIEKIRNEIELSPGAKNLVGALHAAGHVVGVVSGGFISIIEPLLNELGIRYYRANTLEVIDGKLTGKVVGKIIDSEGKAEALQEYAQAERIPIEATIAIGDGANDLEMIKVAGFGIAYRAKPVVQQSADAAINTEYLDSVLYFI